MPDKIRTILRKVFPYVLAFTAFAIGSLLQSRPAPVIDTPITNTSAWAVVSGEEISAKILWQKTENRKALNYTGPVNNDYMSASANQVVYLHYVGADVELITFDLRSGKELWRFVEGIRINFRSIIAVPDAYIFVTDAGEAVGKLEFDGDLDWLNSSFGSRMTRKAYFYDERLYVPSYEKLYQLLLLTGEVENALEISNMTAFLGDIALFSPQLERLEAVNIATGRQLYSISIENTEGPLQAQRNLLEFTQRHGDNFFLYSSVNHPSEIRYHSLQNGTLLWSVNRQVTGFPLVLENYLVFYSPTGLEVIDTASGNTVGKVKLSRNDTLDPEILYVSLAGYGNIVVLWFHETSELVALELDL